MKQAADLETGIDGQHTNKEFSWESRWIGRPYKISVLIPLRTLQFLKSEDWDRVQDAMQGYIDECEKDCFDGGFPSDFARGLLLKKIRLSLGETLTNLLVKKMSAAGNERWGVSPHLQPDIVEAGG